MDGMDLQTRIFALPDPLTDLEGRPVKTADAWMNHRRAELFRLFQDHVYGRTPEGPSEKAVFEETERLDGALSGKAIRIQGNVLCRGVPEGIRPFPVLMYLPRFAGEGGGGPVPVFLGLNFKGNHAISEDPGILISPNGRSPDGTLLHERGCASRRYSLEDLMDSGFGLVTLWNHDVEADRPGSWGGSPRGAYSRGAEPGLQEWGTIGAWAWGLSRVLDALEGIPEVDASRVIVWGHSRLGKTALWASASDPRFAMAISNDSGCTGAALTRFKQGESIAEINRRFPHWFCGNYKQYGEDPIKLPVDQHELIALSAPRPVYVASGVEDLWADPPSEFLAARQASVVYRLFGLEGIPENEGMPEVLHPVGGRGVGYHVRTGGHDVTAYDWKQFIAFAEKNLSLGKQ